MGLYLQRAPGCVPGEPDPARSGIRGDQDPPGKDSHGLFQLRLQLEPALEAGGRGQGDLQRGGAESGNLCGRGHQIRPDRPGALLHLYRQHRPAACGLV